MNAENILTIGIDYRSVHGGVAAVENVYSTFYKPFNHITTVVDGVQVNKLFILCSAFFQFFGWMLFRPQIKIVHVHGASNASFWRKRIFIYIAKLFGKKVIFHTKTEEFAVNGKISSIIEGNGSKFLCISRGVYVNIKHIIKATSKEEHWKTAHHFLSAEGSKAL